MDIKENILYILNNEIKPAIGCTEPVSIALCSAAASSCINGNIDLLEVYLSPNIYKNGMSVGIPNSAKTGLDIAAALGAAKKDYDKGLEILGEIDNSCNTFADMLIKENKVRVIIADTSKKVYIRAMIKSGNNTAEAIIEDKHDNIVKISLNNKTIYSKASSDEATSSCGVDDEFFDTPIMDIIKTVEALDFEDTVHMLSGLNMNMSAAQLGMKQRLGIGTGYAMKQNMDKGIIAADLPNTAMMLTSAASDVRMSGLSVPVMSSNGSGNNGLTAILPIAAYNRVHPTDEVSLSKALAISHVITAYVKYYIGRLSPLCGCSIAASTGSACAITWLMGGSYAQIQGTIKNILANQSGVICDGAKPGCALKLGTAAASGIQSSLLAMEGYYACKNNGIVTGTAEQSIKNLQTLSEKGMSSVDRTIIDIMVNAN